MRVSATLIVAAVCTLLLASVAHGSSSGAVQTLTSAMLEEIAAKGTNSLGSHPTPTASSDAGFDSNSWIIRFTLGWEEDLQGKADFEKAASEIPPSIAMFGNFIVDSADALSMVDMLMIQSFPAVYQFGARVGRPDAPKGHNQVARVTGFHNQYTQSITDMKVFTKFIYQTVSNRYAHPVTNALLPTVSRVSTMKGLMEAATTAGSVSAPTVVFFGKLSGDNVESLAFMHSQGAVLKGRINLVVSTDAPLSREYKTTLGPEDKGFNVVILRRISAAVPAELVMEGQPIEGVLTLEAIGDVIKSALGLSTEGGAAAAAINTPKLESYAIETQLKLTQWARDMKAYVGDSPLRKIDTQEQFLSDVVQVKHSVIALFVLRESDKHFGLHHNIATDVARFSREVQHKSLLTGEPQTGHSIKTDVFWVDAEVHKELARALHIANVPGVCFIMHLQNDLKGVKFFPDHKGKDLPDAKAIKQYLQSDRLIETKQIQQLDLTQVQFTGNPAGSRLAFNNRYLGLDLRDYNPDLADPNQQQQQPAEDDEGNPIKPKQTIHLVRELLAQAELDAIEAAKPENKKKKLTPKQEAAKLAKEEAKMAAIAEEQEKKKKEREERMAAKAIKDAEIAAKIEAKKAAEKAAEKGKPKKKKAAKKKKKANKAWKVKPARDLKQEQKVWEEESAVMADQFITIDPETGKLSVVDSLVAPAAATQEQPNADL